jgi:hypothetical protein
MNLYFGSTIATFDTVPGISHSYQSGLFVEMNEDHLKKISRSRCTLPPKCDGPYLTIVLPGIPATDPVPTDLIVTSSLPFCLRKPLIKSAKGHIKGMQSGTRSGIIQDGDIYYRLKGCGNNYDGFPFRSVEDDNRDDLVEIRGCTFEHTSSRELLYFDKINRSLTELHIPISNKPLGWMEYQIPNTPLKSIKRICTLYEAISDKRLSDHLLTGLERILPLICETNEKSYFPSERFNGSELIQSTWAFLGGITMVDAVDLIIKEKIPSIPHENVGKHRLQEWKRCCEVLSGFKKSDEFKGSLIAYLYWTLGHEVGVIQRMLSQNKISWGTYTDRLGMHCNSHANNLCVLPPGHGRFLAPLDFDMAFSKEFFDKDEKTFENWLTMEESSQAYSLGGSELNSGVRPEEVIKDPMVNDLRYALRDTILLGYRCGLTGEENSHKTMDELEKYWYCLIEMALMTTEDIIA